MTSPAIESSLGISAFFVIVFLPHNAHTTALNLCQVSHTFLTLNENAAPLSVLWRIISSSSSRRWKSHGPVPGVKLMSYLHCYLRSESQLGIPSPSLYLSFIIYGWGNFNNEITRDALGFFFVIFIKILLQFFLPSSSGSLPRAPEMKDEPGRRKSSNNARKCLRPTQ